MTKANGKCNRCSGRGFRDCAQAHLGVPGLCFDCNGSGRYEDQAATKAAARASKIAEAKLRAITQPVYDKIWEVRRNAKDFGYPHASRDQRVWFRQAGTFSTQDFADAWGLAKVDAWRLLCCSYPDVGIVVDHEAGKVVGWAREYNA